MAHVHDVFNTDERFVIDPDKRKITQLSGKNQLIRGDHNSECYAFEMPRLVDAHDMSVCNSVRIHYRNTSSDRSGECADIYTVMDLQINPEDESKILFSWTLSRNTTKYAGALSFSIEFRCLTNTIVEYQWTAGTFNGISVIDRVENDSNEIVEDHIDILEGWREELFGGGSDTDITSETIATALGYIPADIENVNQLAEEIAEKGNVKTVNGIAPDTKGNVSITTGMPSPEDITYHGEDLLLNGKVLGVGMDDDFNSTWELLDAPWNEQVRFTPQTLNVDQQAQARENIGAADLDSLIEVFEDIDDLRASAGGNAIVGVIDSHYYNFRLLNEDRGATMAEIREAALSEDKDIVIRLDLDNWQGTLHYLGLVDLTDDGSTYQKVLLFSTVKMNNGIINTSDNIVSGDVLLEYWYTTVESGTIMPPNAFMNCQFAKINLAPGSKHAGSFMRVNEDGLWDVEKVDIVQAPATAIVGQTLVVKAVDDNGKPIEWEAVDAGNTGGDSNFTKLNLIDEVTGSKYELKVSNGKLTMTEVTE